MKDATHLALIAIGIALAALGGWIIIANMHALTALLLLAGLGTIGVGIGFIAPASLTQATQAAGAGLKAVIAACPGVGQKDGGA